MEGVYHGVVAGEIDGETVGPLLLGGFILFPELLELFDLSELLLLNGLSNFLPYGRL